MQVVSMTCMTFDEVGLLRVYLAGLLQPLTFQWSILYLWQYSELLIRARGASKKEREEREGYGDHPRPKIVQICPVVQALEQFSRMQSEREQTLQMATLRSKASSKSIY